jgi:PAS domain S-box-containing protein
MVSPAAGSLPKGNTASTEETLTHILYVDNEAGLLKAAKPILEMQSSFHVETASSVEEAMKKMEAKTFDAIVCDYIMPGKDGLEFLKELRDSGNSIPFIIFTGKGREIVAIKALNLGADQYINKIGKTEAVYSELAQGIRTVVKGKKAEEALRDSEKEKSAILDSMSELVSHQDLNHRILWVNKKAADSVNMKAEQLKGRYCHELWAKSAKPCAACPLEETIKTGQPQQGEITTPDGRVWSISGYPIKDVNGNTTGIVEVKTEITEHKKAEEKLRESEEKFRNLAEKSPNMIFINKKGRVVYANKRCEEVMGYMREEFYSSDFNFFTLIAPESTKQLKSRYTRHLKGEEIRPYECTLITKEGKRIETILTSKLINYEGEKAILGIITDITERKKTDEKLKESERKYRLLTENTTDVIYIQDMNLNVTYASPSVEKISGYTPEELSKLRPENFMTPESFERGVADFKEAITSATEEQDYEIPLKQYEYVRKDGSTFWGELKMKLLRDSNNNLVGVQGTLRDITERKEAEKKLDKMMNELVAINEKLGVVGRLTRHDARNKLSVIANNVYLAKQKIAPNNDAIEFLDDVESAVDQIEKIFDFARNYEMLGVEDLSHMNVGKSVEEAAILLSGMNGVKLVNECKGLMVMADSLLRQLFYNLIDNTLKYGEKASQIRVYYEEGKDRLRLVYEDDGVGIPENEKEKLFKEGYGKSTGYGLYLIKKMCEEYGWAVRETGKQGKGAQFTMIIPKTAKNGKKSYRIN